jgi:hypothetical protein
MTNPPKSNGLDDGSNDAICCSLAAKKKELDKYKNEDDDISL